MNIIAISGKRRTGKSTLANILTREYGYNVVNLADPLKAICREHFGLTCDQTDGPFKESPTHYKREDVYLTPRQIMIDTGQFYRSIDPDFWVKKLLQQIKDDPLVVYVVPDVRFLNELGHMQELGAILVRLDRDEKYTGKNINDSSETDLDTFDGWDFYVRPEYNKTVDDLYAVAEEIDEYIQGH